MHQETMRGFTLIELTVVIIVIGILAAIALDSNAGYQLRARDIERKNDITIITKELERAYRTQAATTGPSYPPTTSGSSGVGAIINDAGAVTAPNQSSNSIVIASSTTSQTPTISQYIYQPFDSSGALCSTAPCVKYRLYYREEGGAGNIITINSLRQQ